MEACGLLSNSIEVGEKSYRAKREIGAGGVERVILITVSRLKVGVRVRLSGARIATSTSTYSLTAVRQGPPNSP